MNISSSCLFHFTTKFQCLQGIIESGFKFRPCREELRIGDGSSFLFDCGGITCVDQPSIICFCDLPLSASQDHRQQYGGYAIAMTKEWGMLNGATPVRYVHARSPDFTNAAYKRILQFPEKLQDNGHNVFQLLSRALAKSGDREAPTETDFRNLPNGIQKVMTLANAEFLHLLSHWHNSMQYVRAYEGDWPDRTTDKMSRRVFYDEREWRAVSAAEDDWIPFKFRDVRYLIVTSKAERKTLAEQIMAAADDLEIDDVNDVWCRIQIGTELFSDV